MLFIPVGDHPERSSAAQNTSARSGEAVDRDLDLDARNV